MNIFFSPKTTNEILQFFQVQTNIEAHTTNQLTIWAAGTAGGYSGGYMYTGLAVATGVAIGAGTCAVAF
jgi:hypothetical protein